MIKNLCTFIFLVGVSLVGMAQNISEHQWKHRVLLVMTPDDSHPDFLKQLDELRAHQKGLEERKLKVYLVTPQGYKMLDAPSYSPTTGDGLYATYNLKGATPEVLLMGLDGQRKHQKYSFTPASELFLIIDAMPMRQTELKQKKQQ